MSWKGPGSSYKTICRGYPVEFSNSSSGWETLKGYQYFETKCGCTHLKDTNSERQFHKAYFTHLSRQVFYFECLSFSVGYQQKCSRDPLKRSKVYIAWVLIAASIPNIYREGEWVSSFKENYLVWLNEARINCWLYHLAHCCDRSIFIKKI